MVENDFSFSAQVQRFPGFASWYYAVIPNHITGQIKAKFGFVRRGWRSYPVRATLGSTNWTTSIFPHQGIYFLALKADVRNKEKTVVGDIVNLHLEIMDDLFCPSV